MVNDMERRQFYTKCRFCGKAILMTRNIDNGKFKPCNPEILHFVPDEEAEDVFVNENGQNVHGIPDSHIGAIGYKRHYCKTRASA